MLLHSPFAHAQGISIGLCLTLALLGGCDSGGSGGSGASSGSGGGGVAQPESPRNQPRDTNGNGIADHFDVYGDWTGDGCNGVPDGRETPDDLHCAVLAVADEPAARTVTVHAGIFDANAPGYRSDLSALITLPARTRFEMKPGTWLVGYDTDTLRSKATSTRLLTTANVVPLGDRRATARPDDYESIAGIDVTLRTGYALSPSGYDTRSWPTRNHFGIYLLQCMSCSVRDSEVAATVHSALYARSMQSGTIADNTFGPAAGEFDSSGRSPHHGIYLFAANGIDVTGVEVLRNVIRGAGKDALHTRGERHWSRTNLRCTAGDWGRCDGQSGPGTTCAGDADCGGGQRCESTATCLAGPFDGAPCTSDAACGSRTCARDRCEAAFVRDTRFADNEVEAANAYCIGVESSERVLYEGQRCADSLAVHVVGAPPSEGESCDAEFECVGGDAPGLACLSDAECGVGSLDDPLDDGYCASARAAGASCKVEFRELRVERPRTPLPSQLDALIEIGVQAREVLISGLALPAAFADASCIRIRELSRGISIEDAELLDCGSAAISSPDRGGIEDLRLEEVTIDGYGDAPGGSRHALHFAGPVSGFTASGLSIRNRDPARSEAAVRFDDGDLEGLAWSEFIITSEAPELLGIWLRDISGAPDVYRDVSFAHGDFLYPVGVSSDASLAILQDGTETELQGLTLEDLTVVSAPVAGPCFQLGASGSQTSIRLVDLGCPADDVIDGVDPTQLAPGSRVLDDDVPEAGSPCTGEMAVWSDGAITRICTGGLWM